MPGPLHGVEFYRPRHRVKRWLVRTALAARVLVPLLPVAAGATPPETPLELSPPDTVWEGAIGVIGSYRPEYSGATQRVTKVSPAVFLRYGRFTITNASGFVTRRAGDVVRGLGVDLASSERLRVNLALRFDAGRSEGSSASFAGLGDIDPTVRARINLGWQFAGPFRLGASWSADALGRGGGSFGELSLGWEHRFAPTTVLSAGLALSAAGDRYMQTYYGISEAQASRTTYRVYTPGAGLRDVAATVGFRTDLGEDWILLAGAGATRLLGAAARSPLSTSRNGWGINAGLAWRF
jgi:MipA family protein